MLCIIDEKLHLLKNFLYKSLVYDRKKELSILMEPYFGSRAASRVILPLNFGSVSSWVIQIGAKQTAH